MKQFGKKVVEASLVRSIWFLYSRWRDTKLRDSVLDKLWYEAIDESAELAKKNLHTAVLFRRREDLWTFCIERIPTENLILEFGVHEGGSINFLARLLKAKSDQRKLFGFDSFEGLEEEWYGESLGKGFFNLGGRLPKVSPAVQLIPGWIQNTLGPFLAEHPDDKIAFIHIDTDTYTPAKLILSTCKPRLLKGSVIVFDELYGYPNWKNHEYKALNEVFSESEYEFIALSNRQAAIRVK